MLREDWLDEAINRWRPRFKEAGESVPKVVRVSVGWPGGRGKKRGVVGQCFVGAADGKPAVFVSPVLNDPVEVFLTLGHELVHATHENRSGHRSAFGKLAKKVGFIAPWTSTPATPELRAWAKEQVKELGKYEHGKLNESAMKVQTTRLLKVACPNLHEGKQYVARITRKWIDFGLPTCPCGEMMEEAV